MIQTLLTIIFCLGALGYIWVFLKLLKRGFADNLNGEKTEKGKKTTKKENRIISLSTVLMSTSVLAFILLNILFHFYKNR